MNTVFRRKSIQSGDMNSEDEFIKEKSLMSLQATPVSPGVGPVLSRATTLSPHVGWSPALHQRLPLSSP